MLSSTNSRTQKKLYIINTKKILSRLENILSDSDTNEDCIKYKSKRRKNIELVPFFGSGSNTRYFTS